MIGKVEVYMTMDMGRFGKAKDILKSHNIDFWVTTKPQGGYDFASASQRMGRFGEKFECNLTYYIHTKKDMAEQAKHCLGKEM